MPFHNYGTLRSLLQELNDPFAIFPLQDVARSLAESVSESEEYFREREEPWGVSRKYWDVPMELLDHGIGVAIGSAFVLGQAAITQSVSIVGQIRKHANDFSGIPKKKRAILETEAKIMLRSQLSDMVVIDTAANYFKHRHEWPADWQNDQGSVAQRQTMADAHRIGMTEHDFCNNMRAAVYELGLDTNGVFSVPMIVHGWRERLTLKLCCEVGIPFDDI